MSRQISGIAVCVVIATAVVVLALCRCERDADGPKRDPQPPRVIEGTLAITNVTVIDVETESTRRNYTVFICGDRILEVSPAETIVPAAGVKVIDGTNKFLLSGLWDMHVHLVEPEMASYFLKYGVTGVRHMFSPLPAVNVRASDPTQGGIGPRVVAATHLLDGKRTTFKTLGFVYENVLQAETKTDAELATRKAKKLGNDFVKVHSNLPRIAYFAALVEAKTQGLKVSGHIPYGVSVAEACAAGQHTIEHLDGVAVACAASDRYSQQRRQLVDQHVPHQQARIDLEAALDYNEKQAANVFQTFIRNGTWHVPTLVQTRAVAHGGNANIIDPIIEEKLPATIRSLWMRRTTKNGEVEVFGQRFTRKQLTERKEQFQEEQKIVGKMEKAGVRLLAGTDTPYPLVVPGLALHEELELMVEAGLTPFAALKSATINPAQCLGYEKDLGSIAVGKYADLILLTSDPTQNITHTRHIEKVIVAGKVVP